MSKPKQQLSFNNHHFEAFFRKWVNRLLLQGQLSLVDHHQLVLATPCYPTSRPESLGTFEPSQLPDTLLQGAQDQGHRHSRSIQDIQVFFF